MKLFWLSSFLLFSSFASAQQLLTLEELDTVKVFTAIESIVEAPNEVIRLELKKQKLKTIPPEVFACKNLQYLDLSKNKLDTFPTELGELTQLRVLILNRNELNYLPEAIGRLNNLIVLRVSNNYLWEIDDALGKLTELEILDIWANRLIVLPYTVQDMPKLREVDMRVNPVKREVQEEFQSYLPDCTLHFSYDCKCY